MLLCWVWGTGVWDFMLERSFSSWDLEGASLPWMVSNSSGLNVSKSRVTGLKLLE